MRGEARISSGAVELFDVNMLPSTLGGVGASTLDDAVSPTRSGGVGDTLGGGFARIALSFPMTHAWRSLYCATGGGTTCRCSKSSVVVLTVRPSSEMVDMYVTVI